jgi:undecaprenyl pyrophosphate phosphatase UppP
VTTDPATRGVEIGVTVIVLGIIILILGLVLDTTIKGLLTGIGLVLIVLGAVFWILGRSGRRIGGRSHWY